MTWIFLGDGSGSGGRDPLTLFPRLDSNLQSFYLSLLRKWYYNRCVSLSPARILSLWYLNMKLAVLFDVFRKMKHLCFTSTIVAWLHSYFIVIKYYLFTTTPFHLSGLPKMAQIHKVIHSFKENAGHAKGSKSFKSTGPI